MRVVQASGLMLLHVTHVRNKHRHPLLGLAGAPCVVLQTCVHSRNRRGEGAPTGVWVTGNRNAHGNSCDSCPLCLLEWWLLAEPQLLTNATAHSIGPSCSHGSLHAPEMTSCPSLDQSLELGVRLSLRLRSGAGGPLLDPGVGAAAPAELSWVGENCYRALKEPCSIFFHGTFLTPLIERCRIPRVS